MRFFPRIIFFFCLSSAVAFPGSDRDPIWLERIKKSVAVRRACCVAFVKKYWMKKMERDLRLSLPYISSCLVIQAALSTRGRVVALRGAAFCSALWVLLDAVHQHVLVLPDYLRSLKHVEVCPIYSCTQMGDSCGWYVLFNACAIQELLKNGDPIVADPIGLWVRQKLIPQVYNQEQDLLKRLEVPHIFGWLKASHIEKLATYFNLCNYHQIEVSREIGMPAFCYRGCPDANIEPFLEKRPGPYREITRIGDMLKQIVGRDNAVQHILFSVPIGSQHDEYHVVLISIIKRANNKPLIIYMDSNNRSFEQCDFEYIVPYFVAEFIKQLDDAVGS